MEEAQKLKDLEIRVSSYPDRATFIFVDSQATLYRANQFLKDIIGMDKEVDAFFDPTISGLNKLHKEEIKKKSIFKEPLKKAKETVKEEIKKYLVEQDEIRRQAEEKISQEKEEKFEKARELEKGGEKEKAEKIRKEETALATPLPPEVKAEGTHLRKHWTWEVEDLEKIPKEYFTLDRLKINSIVRTMKGKTNIPGIRVFQEPTIATRIK